MLTIITNLLVHSSVAIKLHQVLYELLLFGGHVFLKLAEVSRATAADASDDDRMKDVMTSCSSTASSSVTVRRCAEAEVEFLLWVFCC